jgi:hypothetical protein
MHQEPASATVVVRTIGRESLSRALASILAQDHRPLDAVIVDAKGTAALDLSRLGDVPHVVVGGNALSRPQAANAGLDAARGEYIIFLDDDDWHDPHHVGSLLAALARDRGARVAFSGTRIINPDGKPGGEFGGAFDRPALHRSNYIQLGAGLFARSLAEEGCRFDEELDSFQDWDFWLQLSLRTRFVFTGQASTNWCAGSGSSGAGAGANRDEVACLEFRRRIMQKWASERARLMEHVAYHERRAVRLQRAGRTAEADSTNARVQALRSGDPPPPRAGAGQD